MKKVFLTCVIFAVLLSAASCKIEINGDFQDGEDVSSENELSNSKDEETSSVNSEITSEDVSENVSNDEYDEETEQQNIITPFDGIGFVYNGIAPYCEVSVNKENCSEEAKLYVEYSLDKEYYANGDTVIVTAKLNENAVGLDSELSEKQYSFILENQPYYINNIERLDMSLLNSEIDDYVNAKSAEAVGDTYLFGFSYNGLVYDSVNAKTLEKVYLLSAKDIKSEGDLDYYNCLNFIYAIEAQQRESSAVVHPVTLYVNVKAYNVVAYPDGTLGWGMDDPKSYKLDFESTEKDVENLVSKTITAYATDYNITELEGYVKQ